MALRVSNERLIGKQTQASRAERGIMVNESSYTHL